MKRLVLVQSSGFDTGFSVVENPTPELLQAIWRVKEATEAYRAIPPHPIEETSFQCKPEPLIDELDFDQNITVVDECTVIAIEYCPEGDGYSLCCSSQEQIAMREQERIGIEIEGWSEIEG